MRAHHNDRVPLADLCRMCGMSERALRNAFYSVRGMSPNRAIRVDRLAHVRRALSDPLGAARTVTHVAADHGFFELGRFAAAYRQMFGETPSDTRRRAVQEAHDRDGRLVRGEFHAGTK